MNRTIICILFAASISTIASAQEVTKKQWIAGMKTALPAHFCQQSQYFRQCFDVSANKCEEVAASSTRICLSELGNQIPNVLVQPKDGTHWGAKVGQCAGTTYETVLKKKRISNSKCNDISNWL